MDAIYEWPLMLSILWKSFFTSTALAWVKIWRFDRNWTFILTLDRVTEVLLPQRTYSHTSRLAWSSRFSEKIKLMKNLSNITVAKISSAKTQSDAISIQIIHSLDIVLIRFDLAANANLKSLNHKNSQKKVIHKQKEPAIKKYHKTLIILILYYPTSILL